MKKDSRQSYSAPKALRLALTEDGCHLNDSIYDLNSPESPSREKQIVQEPDSRLPRTAAINDLPGHWGRAFTCVHVCLCVCTSMSIHPRTYLPWADTGPSPQQIASDHLQKERPHTAEVVTPAVRDKGSDGGALPLLSVWL